MNYQRHYDALISRAQNRLRPEGYVERHHIVPRCMGGGDESTNIAVLTGREHYVAHLLLARIHGGKLWKAIHRMAYGLSRQNSRMFERARIELSLSMVEVGKVRGKIVGKLCKEQKLGIFAEGMARKGALATMELNIGVFGDETARSRGGISSGNAAVKNKTGIHAFTKEQFSAQGIKNGKNLFLDKKGMFSPEKAGVGGKNNYEINKNNPKSIFSQNYTCKVCGKMCSLGSLTLHQKASKHEGIILP